MAQLVEDAAERTFQAIDRRRAEAGSPAVVDDRRERAEDLRAWRPPSVVLDEGALWGGFFSVSPAGGVRVT